MKPLIPVWRTWWTEWTDAQRKAFNDAVKAGMLLLDAAAAANSIPVDEEPEPEPVKETPPLRKPRAKKA